MLHRHASSVANGIAEIEGPASIAEGDARDPRRTIGRMVRVSPLRKFVDVAERQPFRSGGFRCQNQLRKYVSPLFAQFRRLWLRRRWHKPARTLSSLTRSMARLVPRPFMQ